MHRPTAAWCPSSRRATTSGACCRCCSRCCRKPTWRLDDIDVVAYTRGPGLAGALLVGAGVRQCAWRGARPAGARRAPPRRPSAVAVPVGRSTAVPVRRAAGVGRAHATDARRRRRATTSCWARRSTTPPARRSTRAPRCWAWATRAGPALSALADAGRCRRVRPAAPAAAQRRPRLLVRRPEDRGAGRSIASSGSQPSQQDAGRPRRIDAGGDRRRAGAQVGAGACATPGCKRLVVAGGVGANALLRARLNALASQAAVARALPGAGTVHRQRRDDRAGRRDADAARPGRAVARLCVRRDAALAAGADLHGLCAGGGRALSASSVS